MTSEPLVTRDQFHNAHLRGLHLRVSAIQAFADAGYDLNHIRREYPVLLHWSDDDLTRALTYPKIEQELYRGPVCIDLDHAGDISVTGWFGHRAADDVIVAIREACGLVAAWERACADWEAT